MVALVGGWRLASLIGPSYAIPSWQRIFEALLTIPLKDVTVTVLRLVSSMIASFILGLAVSSLLFERPIAEAFWMPFVRLLMAVPAVCWVVFAILWFSNVELQIFFVMCVVCAPVFIVDSLDAMKGVPAELRQMVELVPAERGPGIH